ncbi:PqiC family protein [Roseomonas sp. HJA6]|uniref:PqiC family protein n=1 Tax=Roseomonas alba TaxID=2846776 RepID=A0ABS7A7A0_9PROT|nr:PqiC family protein [Neoroseomonas alba]MBW6398182.1 PqiC family protein [Neoroseomonas alba]
MTFRRRDAASLGALALLAACRSTEPVLYTLQPVPGTQRRGGPRNIGVRDVSLARYLDRVQIVRSVDDYRLSVSGNDWWGENLDTMMTRVLVENLAQRLSASNVFSTGGAISVTPEALVEVNLQRLVQTGPDSLVMTAQIAVTLREPRRREIARTETVTAPVGGADMPAFVAAASQAAGRLADATAALLAS